MPGATAVPDIELVIERAGGGGGRGMPPAGGGDDGGGDDGNRRRKRGPVSPRRYFKGVTLAIVSILMFFMALASAFLVRRGTGTDWVPVHLPPILWFSTAILILSSVTLEVARARLSRAEVGSFRKLWSFTTFLGLLFLTGQVIAWRQLAEQGVYIASNPASSFFYIFTGAHGLHLIGGIAALLYVSFRNFDKAKVSLSTAAEVSSHYWHFMDALWVFLLALMYLGK